MTAKPVILLLSVAMLASFGGALAYRIVYLQGPPEQVNRQITPSAAISGDVIGKPRPDYTLGSSTGERVSAVDFDGEVVLLNFWATWCKPCREEMPMLVDLHHAYRDQGFQVVGIALDDVQQARDFAADLGVDYTVLVGSADVMATVSLFGNLSGVLPYSVLIDRDGIIRWAQSGIVDDKDLIPRLDDLLAQTRSSGSEKEIP